MTDTRVNAPRPPMPRRGLYLVTADSSDSDWLLARTAAALDAGAAVLQYRSKLPDAALRRAQAAALRRLCADAGIPFIVNDDVVLAEAVAADGVHLGASDAPIAEARARLGRARIIGATCHDDLARAARAAAEGADYLAFGAFHASATKPGARAADPAVLGRAAQFSLPRVAIGGIRIDNAAPLIAAGADLLAVVGAIYDTALDHAQAARNAAALARAAAPAHHRHTEPP